MSLVTGKFAPVVIEEVKEETEEKEETSKVQEKGLQAARRYTFHVQMLQQIILFNP